MMRQGWASALIVAAVGLLTGSTGCSTESFCFSDCDGEGTTGGSAGGGAGGTAAIGGTGGIGNIGGDSGIIIGGSGGTGATDACVANPPEICNGVDDDCDGVIDNGIDWTAAEHCGTCDTNCTQLPHTVNQTCNAPSTLDGTVAGTCKYECEVDFYDLDPQVDGCEYQCPWNPNGTNTVDTGGENGCGRDDDCDGTVDEDLDVCADVDNCGKCGKKCALPNATAKCVSTATGSACNATNTGCEIANCTAGYYDVNKSPDDGCEYQCPQGTASPEVCDGLDNDCDGLIDNADPSMETSDTNIGTACFGGTQGECATTAHQGLKKCVGGVITCCDPDSNTVNGTNPNFPVTGVRNGVCDATTGVQVLEPGDEQEKCNGKDDDCDGTPDDSPIDEGSKCGISQGNCVQGTEQCQNGGLVCVGKVDPVPEVCNLQDDDCDGAIDGTVPSGTPVSCTTNANCAAGQLCAQVGASKQCVTAPSNAIGDCAPPGLTLPVPAPCQKGTLSCAGGVVKCEGYVGPASSTDACGVDSNCDGALTNQPNFQSDVNNCGSCGNKCGTAGDHGVWACQLVSGTPTCVRTGCDNGFINCDGNANDCEKACTFVSSTEQCNGVDDNCNCQVDENITNKPSPVQVCGVSAGATDAGCKDPANGGTVNVTCAGSNGWNCTFPAGYCTGTKPNYCTGTADVCDGKDNNCNGAADEAYTLAGGKTQGYLGQPCASDDGLPPPGHGVCKGTGAFVCDTTTTTKCNAVKNNAAAGAELCDGQDNDCDGTVDEPFKITSLYPAGKGTNTTYFVKPAVTKIAASLWVSQYEVSRPGATNINPGSGNGYQTSAPAGATIDKTQACSVSGVVPWFNITPVEAAQTCAQRGGRLCSTSDWQAACQATASCKWGYNPRTGACNQPSDYLTTGQRVCNLGYFDFAPATPGNQDGLLPTASASLNNCWADWSGLQGNGAATNNLRDITGNLRELTYNATASSGCTTGTTNPSGGCLYTLMGGAFNSDAEDGAACNFTFFTVDAQYKLFDVGYRCCFDQDPTL